MAMPTAAEVVCLYLYGQKTPPADLKTENLIRPTGPGSTPLVVDANEYMTTGGGRFFKPHNFNYVRNFIGAHDYPGKTLAAGTYTRDQLLAAYGIGNGRLGNRTQYYLGMLDADYIDRAYVFGSGEFEINPEAKFIVNPDGSREIADIAVIPVADNFDYESNSLPAEITNALSLERIDPSRIGRQVPITFTGTVTNREVYNGEDWYAMTANNELDMAAYNASKLGTPGAAQAWLGLMASFVASGIISYKDADGRFVYYDGISPNNNGTLDGFDALTKMWAYGHVFTGSVALIGGGGNDRETGWRFDDELYGHGGNDTLDGGNGRDSLDGGAGNDTLYGGNENDTLVGGEDNDRLEGQADNDFLWGSKGDDTLLGGDGVDSLTGGIGNDSLDGGAESDQLAGGVGYDRYDFSGPFGSDVVRDDDGSGSIRIDGAIMTGGKREEGKPYYEDKATGAIFFKNGGTLTIVRKGSQGAVTVQNWSQGQLGITLKEDIKKPKPIVSPIALDLDGDGVETIGLDGKAYFDHGGDGFAERTGWVGSDDGLLVRDLNGDGRIERGAELFGSETRLASGQKAADGFAALRELDANADGKVDAADAGFAQLKVWRDLNSDGRTDAGELLSLTEAGVQALLTEHRRSGVVDANGNELRELGRYVHTDSSTRDATDVWFKTDRSDSRAAGEEPPVDAAIAALPDIEGYGVLGSLHQAMAKDDMLRAQVAFFASETDPNLRAIAMRDILWRWTGADGKSSNSRGGYITEARWLYVVEAFTGEGFIQYAGTNQGLPDPGPMATLDIYDIARTHYETFFARLMAQSHLKDLFDSLQANWNADAQNLSIDATQAALTLKAAVEQDRPLGLQRIGEFSRALRALGQFTAEVSATLLGTLAPLGEDVVVALVSMPPTGFGLDGSNGQDRDDVLFGTAAGDTLSGFGGNDVIYGQAGVDDLIGGGGDDVLDGGAGDDRLFGNEGADTYLFGRGSGRDLIENRDYDALGTKQDRILLGAGIAPQDVVLTRSAQDLVLGIVGTPDQLTVRDFFVGDAAAGHQVDTIQFADQTVWNVRAIKAAVLRATEQADMLSGFDSADRIDGLAGNDSIDGGGDNDEITGGAGDDTLGGGNGADTLSGGVGNDVLDGGNGDDEYRFGLGDGHEVLREGWSGGGIGGTDTVRLGAGVTPGNLKVTRDGTDIVLRLPGHVEGSVYVEDSLRLQDVLAGDVVPDHAIERIVFADGTEWALDDLKSRLIEGGDGDDRLQGYAVADALNGMGGNDTLIGMAGADVLRGDAGSDQLFGGDGDDDLDGGAGNDTLSGGAGNNLYRLKPGGGQDVVERSFLDLLTASDTVLVPFDVGLENIEMLREGVDVVFRIKGTDDSLRLKGVMVNDGISSSYGFRFQIQGGAILDLMALKLALLQGGSGSDTLTGYATDDVLNGGLGDDLIDGAGGSDTLTGGLGDDRFEVDSAADVIVEAAGEGNDLVFSSAGSYALSAELETLELREGSGAWEGIGNAGANSIVGNSGANRLDGGLGIDTLVGGAGDDTYVVDTLDDAIVEAEDGGEDTVETALSYELAATLENLALLGDTDAAATGNDKSNRIDGNAGANRIDGGLGADRMAGGAGDDVYRVEDEGDDVVEQDGEGVDTVERSFDTTLILTRNVENLTLLGEVYRGNGNELDNLIVGNAADNNLLGLEGDDTLIGGDGDDAMFGSEGADSMVGGNGDDYYAVDDATDTLVEAAGAGDDFVRSTVDWTLGANFERLALDGDENLTATGNALGNGLWGNAGDNLLTGGLGNDFLSGGAGNDRYVFNKGDGQDSIDNLDLADAQDTLVVGAADTEVQAFKSGDNLFFKFAGSTDQIGLIGYYAAATPDGEGNARDRRIDSVEFANGVVWDQAMIQTVVDRASNNHAPKVTGSVPTLVAREGSQFSYVVPVGTITDQDPWDSLRYSLKMPNGSAVPAWLRIDAVTREITATPASGSAGSLQFVLWGTDMYGYAAGTYVTMTIKAPNTAPVLVTALPDQAATEASPFAYQVSSTAFKDNDAGDSLGYTATLADGSALPGWLTFTPANRSFSGTPPVGAAGQLAVRVRATDTGGLSIADEFMLTITVGNLTKTGTSGADTLAGGSGHDTLSGLGGNDHLSGLAGNDRLDGGTGNDTLVGGAGDDLYIVDASSDVVTELAGEGIDLVQSTATYTLAANVENLTLSGTGTINGTGNTLDNLLTGNGANNQLSGAAGNDTLDGGLGNDTMTGGAGNDAYVVNVSTDVVTELANEGLDSVASAVTYTLGSNVENLALTGTGTINGTGNTLDNLLTGNDANNQLSGAAGNDTLDGGLGNDTMTGGAGNDTFVVNVSTDVVNENANEGTDTVRSAVTYTLGSNLENLSLTGTAAINGTGNTGANLLVGNDGANALTGGAGNDTLDGGLGSDTLTGGTGADEYRFGRGHGADRIVENDATANVKDVVRFGAGVNQADVRFTRSGNALVATINGTSDALTLQDWYLGNQYHVEEFRFADNSVLTDVQTQSLVQAMAAFAPSGAAIAMVPVRDDGPDRGYGRIAANAIA